ncbi:MAG TPA: glycosyltransferase [Terrimicrobiaceae bacterium]|nr:glycosyltransferase [Terrimicrobiaceae bacterium]
MRFFHIALSYKQHLDAFYGANPELRASGSYAQIQQALFADAFNALHLFGEDMPQFGYASAVAVPNDPVAQHKWKSEYAPHLKRGPGKDVPPPGAYGKFLTDDLLEILIEQVNQFRPDVIYLQDPVGFDGRFLGMLKQRPSLVIGWRAAGIPKSCEWRDIDFLVSNHQPSLDEARRLGVRWQERLLPGFPAWIAGAMRPSDERCDVMFAGNVSYEHKTRMRILTHLAGAPLRSERDISIHYHTDPEPTLPSGICMLAQRQLWGLEMFQGLRNGRIALNVHIDLAGREAANMRLFEATGAGAFLLTDHKPNIADYFEPGREVETFQTPSEMMEKIFYYLDHPEKRHAIATAGQQKTLRNFTREQSSGRLHELIQRALAAKSSGNRSLEKLASFFRRGLKSIPHPAGSSRPRTES